MVTWHSLVVKVNWQRANESSVGLKQMNSNGSIYQLKVPNNPLIMPLVVCHAAASSQIWCNAQRANIT